MLDQGLQLILQDNAKYFTFIFIKFKFLQINHGKAKTLIEGNHNTK